MNQKEEKEKVLSKSTLFEDIPEEKLIEIADVAQKNIVPARTTVFKQGDLADNFYISGHKDHVF